MSFGMRAASHLVAALVGRAGGVDVDPVSRQCAIVTTPGTKVPEGKDLGNRPRKFLLGQTSCLGPGPEVQTHGLTSTDQDIDDRNQVLWHV